MKIPKKLKIGGHDIQVRLIEFGDADGLCGNTAYSKGEITINKELPQSQREATLIHEIFHVLNTTMSHDLIDSLSEQLYQVLKENDLLK